MYCLENRINYCFDFTPFVLGWYYPLIYLVFIFFYIGRNADFCDVSFPSIALKRDNIFSSDTQKALNGASWIVDRNTAYWI